MQQREIKQWNPISKGEWAGRWKMKSLKKFQKGYSKEHLILGMEIAELATFMSASHFYIPYVHTTNPFGGLRKEVLQIKSRRLCVLKSTSESQWPDQILTWLESLLLLIQFRSSAHSFSRPLNSISPPPYSSLPSCQLVQFTHRFA